VTFKPTEPAPTGPDSLTPKERDAVIACAPASAGAPGEPASVTAGKLLTCLAKGLETPQDDPRLVWIVAQLVGLPPEQVPLTGTS
jgi:hypothetical protein